MASTTTAAGGPPTTISAPFTHAHVILTDPNASRGCGYGTHLNRAFFHKGTGVGGFRENASSSNCGSSSNNSVSYGGNFTVLLPFRVALSGPYSLTTSWVGAATGGVNLTSSNCTVTSAVGIALCTIWASVFLAGQATLFDRTTGTSVVPNNAWAGASATVYNKTVCVGKKCTTRGTNATSTKLHTGALAWQWYWNSTMLKRGHGYELRLKIWGGVNIVLTAVGGKFGGPVSAAGVLNSATHGQHEQLVSFTIT